MEGVSAAWSKLSSRCSPLENLCQMCKLVVVQDVYCKECIQYLFYRVLPLPPSSVPACSSGGRGEIFQPPLVIKEVRKIFETVNYSKCHLTK